MNLIYRNNKSSLLAMLQNNPLINPWQGLEIFVYCICALEPSIIWLVVSYNQTISKPLAISPCLKFALLVFRKLLYLFFAYPYLLKLSDSQLSVLLPPHLGPWVHSLPSLEQVLLGPNLAMW